MLLAKNYSFDAKTVEEVERRFITAERNAEAARQELNWALETKTSTRACWYMLWKAGFVTTAQVTRWIPDIILSVPQPPDPETAPDYEVMFPNVILVTP